MRGWTSWVGRCAVSGEASDDGARRAGLEPPSREGLVEPSLVARRALERAKRAAQAKGLSPGRPGRRRRPVVEAQLAGSGRDPQLLGDAAAGLLVERGWQVEVTVGGLFARWSQIVGEHVAEHCVPESFEDGCLVVRASSSAWATNLRVFTSSMLARLGEELGEGVVTEVKVLAPVGPSFRKGPLSVPGRGERDTWV